jgi:hypothetical protein
MNMHVIIDDLTGVPIKEGVYYEINTRTFYDETGMPNVRDGEVKHFRDHSDAIKYLTMKTIDGPFAPIAFIVRHYTIVLPATHG